MFFINLPTAKFLYEAAYLAITYWKKVKVYLDVSGGSILNIHLSDGFGKIYLIFLFWFKVSSKSGLIKRMLSDGDFGVAQRQQINVHREQIVVATAKTTVH